MNIYKKLLAGTAILAGFLALSAREKVVCELDLSKIGKVEVKAHVNEKNAPPPAGSSVKVTPKGLELNYVFSSPKHDALMAAFPVRVPKCDFAAVELTTFQKGHRPYLILVDAGNEFHYMSIVQNSYISLQALKSPGRFTYRAPLPLRNRYVGERHASHWGGDNNQRIDFPLKKVYIGLNDYPDTFQGKGKIIFHKIKFYQKQPAK